MQNILEELLASTSYLDPYLRQFTKYLNNKNILTIGKNQEFLTSKIKSMGFNVDNQELINIDYAKSYSGIILFNTLNELDKNDISHVFDSLYKILEDDGYILLTISNNCYNKEYLDVVMGTNYNFIEELSSYENLKFYIYAKKLLNECFFCYNISR